MEMALTFNDVTLSPISHQNNLWIRAVELAHALGYAQENSVSRIYRSNSDEFTPDMTQVIEIFDGADSALSTKARIFSLRGCHLVAMFARTPVAKAFRKWVLDVLDRLAAEERAALPEAPHIKITPSTTASRKPLRALVHAWAQVSGTPHTALWPQVKAHFQLERIDDLPEEWIPDALEWVQGKIDSLPPALPPTDKESLTVAPPTALPFRADFPEDMDAGRKDALKRIQRLTWSLHAALDVVRLFNNPKWHPENNKGISNDIAMNLYRTAEANLVAAYNALEAGYRLGRQNGRG